MFNLHIPIVVEAFIAGALWSAASILILQSVVRYFQISDIEELRRESEKAS